MVQIYKRRNRKMKTASKVFLILTIVASAIGVLVVIFGWEAFVRAIAESAAISAGVTLTTSLLQQVKDAVASYQILMIIVMAIPIVVSAISLKKLANAQWKSELTVMAILTLLFANLIAGILMLCIKDEDL